MGRRRYAESGLGFLLALALVTSATPAAADQTAEPGAAQGSSAQRNAAQQAGVQLDTAQSAAVAPAQGSVEAKAAETPVPGPAKPVRATVPTAPEVPTAEGVDPEVPATPQPITTPAETQQNADPATEPPSDPATVPTQTAPPTSGTENTAQPAPEQQSLVAEPPAKAPEDNSSETEPQVIKDSDEKESSEIVVKVYKMVTALDGDIDGAAPKARWEFSLVDGSIKSANDNATTNEKGVAVFSGESPGNSGKATLTIEETDPSVDQYELVQQGGQNAICSAGGETVPVDNPGKLAYGFQVKASAGETVTCTVYNKPLAAKLTLVNDVENGNDGTANASDWDLIARPEMTSSATVTATGSAEGKSFEVAHGRYELSQSAGPASYTWQSLKCSTDGGPAVDLEDFTVNLDVGTETTCTFTNAYQSIDIDKRAWNTPSFFPGVVYPDAPEFEDGALVPFGTTVTWTYTVTNTGATAINGITVDDDKLAAAVKCPDSRLRPGESMVCTASGQLTS